jgi:hypothetical protein
MKTPRMPYSLQRHLRIEREEDLQDTQRSVAELLTELKGATTNEEKDRIGKEIDVCNYRIRNIRSDRIQPAGTLPNTMKENQQENNDWEKGLAEIILTWAQKKLARATTDAQKQTAQLEVDNAEDSIRFWTDPESYNGDDS